MKLLINLFLFSLSFLVFENKVLSLNDYQIRVFCQKKRNKSSCIKELKEKRSNFLKGNRIEIKVIPFK